MIKLSNSTFLTLLLLINVYEVSMGHDHLLEICLLEKSARHDFIIARHRSSNNIYSCQLLDSRWKPVKLKDQLDSSN